eukprot:gnl/MRDRNA2_/MRDRNA2_31805_c0_seq1.p1 gnl/MRDRNA2_/MRDRNA2_31805_c0~~gnl/MRDRNA2_/MRDRNA2_31805_c0_seq1.p1  ORF type:complete len:336 (+),score=40.62 gnl/MRDRNA2_/MRDRNA2_31805_c0_seq1:117-1124(+)
MLDWVVRYTVPFIVFGSTLEDSTWRSVVVNGRGKTDVFIPSCMSSSSPIIVSLHAWGSNKEQQKEVDRLHTDPYIGEECSVIIYPQGQVRGMLFGAMGFSWNAGGCCPNENKEHVDDVSFIRNLITYVASELEITTLNVFIVGLSNGGMMANRVACADERVRAIVAVSGPLINGTDGNADNVTENFSCTRQVPILHFHGTADPVVPYDGCNISTGNEVCRSLFKMAGGSIAPFPRVLDYVSDWRARNGITREDTGSISFQNGTVTCMSSGESANNVTLCTVEGEGHAWPGECMVTSHIPWFNCSMDIDASSQAMAFFRKHLQKVPRHINAAQILV